MESATRIDENWRASLTHNISKSTRTILLFCSCVLVEQILIAMSFVCACKKHVNKIYLCSLTHAYLELLIWYLHSFLYKTQTYEHLHVATYNHANRFSFFSNYSAPLFPFYFLPTSILLCTISFNPFIEAFLSIQKPFMLDSFLFIKLICFWILYVAWQMFVKRNHVHTQHGHSSTHWARAHKGKLKR